MPVYHVELRHFPSVARAFNIDRETVEQRFLRPWIAGELIEFDDRRWPPEKTKVTVLEADHGLEQVDMGIGRGWGAANKSSRDVTEAMIAHLRRGADARPEVEAFKQTVETGASAPIPFAEVIAMAVHAQPLWRASEQLGLAEQAVWELLHQGRLQIQSGADVVAQERWPAIVLSYSTWSGDSPDPIRLVTP